MKHYQLISPFRIYTAEEPIHDVLENVDLFFETFVFKKI
jgi:hypothetical protein